MEIVVYQLNGGLLQQALSNHFSKIMKSCCKVNIALAVFTGARSTTPEKVVTIETICVNRED